MDSAMLTLMFATATIAMNQAAVGTWLGCARSVHRRQKNVMTVSM
jgi:hypothetical protein